MGATPQIVEKDIPSEMVAEATAKRLELVEAVANHDDELMELFIAEEEVPAATLSDGIRRCAVPLLHCTSPCCEVSWRVKLGSRLFSLMASAVALLETLSLPLGTEAAFVL